MTKRLNLSKPIQTYTALQLTNYTNRSYLSGSLFLVHMHRREEILHISFQRYSSGFAACMGRTTQTQISWSTTSQTLVSSSASRTLSTNTHLSFPLILIFNFGGLVAISPLLQWRSAELRSSHSRAQSCWHILVVVVSWLSQEDPGCWAAADVNQLSSAAAEFMNCVRPVCTTRRLSESNVTVQMHDQLFNEQNEKLFPPSFPFIFSPLYSCYVYFFDITYVYNDLFVLANI